MKMKNENQILTTLALKHAFWARAPGRILHRFCGGRRHRGRWGAGKTVVFARDTVFYSVLGRRRDGAGAASGRPRGDLGAASERPRWGLGKTAIFERDTIFYYVLVGVGGIGTLGFM